MPTTVLSLQEKLFSGALAFGPLAVLQASSGYFRWYDTQLPQAPGKNDLPAIAVRQITNPKDYAYGGRLSTSWYRMEFQIFAQPDSSAANQVALALLAFLDIFNATGISRPNITAFPNFVLDDRGGLEPSLEPPVYKRIIDARIFNNDAQ